MTAPPDPAAHWEDVYRRRDPRTVSWYRAQLETSLALLDAAGLAPGARVLDVGGGASTLVDDLLARGARVTVLDLSPAALAMAQARLGPLADAVEWRVGDVTTAALPAASVDVWHDRAVLHFLIDPAAVAAYAAQAASAVVPGGAAIIGGFAPAGPERCSGLPVARRSAEEIAAALGSAFALVEARAELHHTPDGRPQAFAWARLRRH